MNQININDKLTINKKYYQDLSKFDNLTATEIKDLYQLINEGDTKAFNTLIESNLKLVIHFAKQYKKALNNFDVLEIDDLISEGNIGLIKAANKYKPELNIKFAYYASFWIKKEMQTFIINTTNIIHSPHTKLISDNKITKQIHLLYQIEQREITQNDVENLESFLPSEINHYFLKPSVKRIETDFDLKCELDDEIDLDELNTRIKTGLKYLTTQERTIVKLYFGIDNERKYNLREIGDKLNLSFMRIYQIKEIALNILKEKLK